MLFCSKYMFSYISVEDCNVNDGTSEKPYCMSVSLMKVLGAKNVKVHED
jgi:hypothetical protein